jgi:hypothetical protein
MLRFLLNVLWFVLGGSGDGPGLVAGWSCGGDHDRRAPLGAGLLCDRQLLLLAVRP